jgi:succinoglycan biosynthesis transport protein ExoP
LPIITNKLEMRQVLSDIRQVKQQILELNQRYGPKHPLMIETQNALSDLQRQLKLETEKAIATIKNEYEAAVAQERTLQSALTRAKQEALSLNEKMMEYNLLKRDVDANRSIYETLLMRTKEENLTGNIRNVNVWVTEKAEVPEDPIKPNKLINFALGGFLGLIGGIGMAFFMEHLDNTIKDPDETEKKFGYPVIGVVELLDKKNADNYAQAEPSSSFSESIISLRTAVLLSSADKPPKTVMITSTSPSEGKTTIAINLAQSIAQLGSTVMLIDADLRRPRVHKAFEMSNSEGLSTYLAGVDSSLTTHWDENNKISVLCSGTIPPNPSELLSADRFSLLLDKSKNSFDIIIIDTPPLLSAADALILSKLVEGSIVITKFGETTNERLQRGLKSLQDVNARIMGLVINGIDKKKSDYFSHYGYYQYSEDRKQA